MHTHIYIIYTIYINSLKQPYIKSYSNPQVFLPLDKLSVNPKKKNGQTVPHGYLFAESAPS